MLNVDRTGVARRAPALTLEPSGCHGGPAEAQQPVTISVVDVAGDLSRFR